MAKKKGKADPPKLPMVKGPVIGEIYKFETRYGSKSLVYRGRISASNPLTPNSDEGFYSTITSKGIIYVTRVRNIDRKLETDNDILSRAINNINNISEFEKKSPELTELAISPVMPDDNFNMMCCKQYIVHHHINLREYKNDKRYFKSSVDFSNLMTALSKNTLSFSRLETILDIGGYDVAGLMVRNRETGKIQVLDGTDTVKTEGEMSVKMV